MAMYGAFRRGEFSGRKCTEDERSESEGTFERSENPKGEPGVCERRIAKRGAGDGSAGDFSGRGLHGAEKVFEISS